MKIDQINVYIEYRSKSGPGMVPRDKLLRARVRCRDADGWIYGRELIAPRKVTDAARVRQICVEQLCSLTKRIMFEYDPLLQMVSEVLEVAA